MTRDTSIKGLAFKEMLYSPIFNVVKHAEHIIRHINTYHSGLSVSFTPVTLAPNKGIFRISNTCELHIEGHVDRSNGKPVMLYRLYSTNLSMQSDFFNHVLTYQFKGDDLHELLPNTTQH